MGTKRNGGGGKAKAGGGRAASKRVVAPAARRATEVDPAAATPAGPLAVACKARRDGSADVTVVYAGALAAHDVVLAHAGAWRSGGAPWSEVQDVPLQRAAPGRLVGAIHLPAGSPVEAVELAFRAGEEWDNGGRAPLGYYEWSLRDGQLVVR